MQSLGSTEDDRQQVTQTIIGLLDSWGVTDAQQVRILGLPKGTPTRSIRKFRKNASLPEVPEVMERVKHLVGIADALRTTFPRNAHMAGQWMNEPHRRFDERTPLGTIIEDGLGGLISVRAHLDCAFAWRASDQESAPA